MRKVFIGGCERSGTTFLAGLLAKYEGVIMTPESHFKNTIGRVSIYEHVEHVKKHWRSKTWFPNSFPDDLSKAVDCNELYESMVLQYAKDNGINIANSVEPIWVDHTPENIQYCSRYTEHLDDVVYIHIVRDARAVANSVMGLEWGPNTPRESAIYWLSRLAYGFLAEQQFNAIRVRYEDLVSDTENVLNHLLKQLDVRAEITEKANIALPKYTRSQHQLVGKASDTTKINSWRETLSEDNRSIITFYTHEMLQSLGYVVDDDGQIQMSSLRALRDSFVEIFRKVTNTIKYKFKRG